MTRWFFITASALSLLVSAPLPTRADDGREERRERPRRSIPEFDPAAVGAVAAVLAAGGLLVARRRKR